MKFNDRTKSIIGFALFFIVMALIIAGLSAFHKDVVEERIIDARFIESYVGTETTYEYHYDFFGDGGFKLMPHIHSVSYPDAYEFQYLITYDDGTSLTEWRPITREEYEKWESGKRR